MALRGYHEKQRIRQAVITGEITLTDPGEMLLRLRQLTRHLRLALPTGAVTHSNLVELLGTFEQLDRWMQDGGQLPAAWRLSA